MKLWARPGPDGSARAWSPATSIFMNLFSRGFGWPAGQRSTTRNKARKRMAGRMPPLLRYPDHRAKTFPLRNALSSRGAKSQGLVQTLGQLGQVTPLDQIRDDAGQLPEDVVLVHRTLEILFAAASAGADPGPDHSPNHLQMAVAKISQLLIDLDQRIEESERQPEKRLVAVKHDEERRPE